MKNNKDVVYVLKKIRSDFTSYNGLKYPKRGWVEASDWIDFPECGCGLHGLEWGTGGFDITSYGDLFVIIKVKKSDGYVDLGDKVKFKKGYVVFVTENQQEATEYLTKKYGGVIQGLNFSSSTQKITNQGYRSTANQGDRSTANQGKYSVANQGWGSIAKQGSYSVANQGYNSVANQGYNSTANQGNNSTANQGYRSTANQGSCSVANQGNNSAANQGDNSVANQKAWSVANQGNNSAANQGKMSTANQGKMSTANQGDWSTTNQGSNSTANQGSESTANQGKMSTANQWSGSTANQEDMSVCVVHGSSTVYRGSKLNVLILYDHLFVPVKRKIFTIPEDIKPRETVKIEDKEIIARYTSTPENIQELKDWEVFVFGSNKQGNHAAGAAKLAKDKFGAIDGVGGGLYGQSYAFPTLDKDMKKRGVRALTRSVDRLVKCANSNTNKIFLVTKIGCGIAGFEESEMRKLFDRNDIPANIVLPKGWRDDEQGTPCI